MKILSGVELVPKNYGFKRKDLPTLDLEAVVEGNCLYLIGIFVLQV